MENSQEVEIWLLESHKDSLSDYHYLVRFRVCPCLARHLVVVPTKVMHNPRERPFRNCSKGCH